MANCTSCGAPLPPSKVVCAYCGTRNNVDLQSLGDCTLVATAQPRHCPNCKKEMQCINVASSKDFFIEKCTDCNGLFFDPGELEALLDQKIAHDSTINYERLKELTELRPQTKVSYRHCPVCQKMMNRTNFGTRSGVVIDQCRDHGIFLDGGELRQLLEWQKAGGHFVHERAERARQKEKREQEEREQKKIHATQEFLNQTNSIYNHKEYDVVDVLSSLFSKIFR